MQPAVWRGQRKSVKRASGGEFLLGSGGIVSSTSFSKFDQGWTGSNSVGLTSSPDPLPSSPGGPRMYALQNKSASAPRGKPNSSNRLCSRLLPYGHRESTLLSVAPNFRRLHALLRLRDHVLDQIFLRKVGMVLKHFLPDSHRAIHVVLPFPPDDANVHQRPRVLRIVTQRAV